MGNGKELSPVLIAYVKHNRLQLCLDSFSEIMSKVGSRPVSIVSVCHSSNDYKNLIINECLRYIDNFDINKTYDSQYVWKSDHKCQT